MAALELRDLSMRFVDPGGGVVEALAPLTLDIPEGQLVSVLGPSGCGKTTLLSILAGFLQPTGGEVRLDGRPIVGPGPDRGVVFQTGALFEWMDVRRNVGFGPRMRGERPAAVEAIVAPLLEAMGLAAFGDSAVWRLSGGMRQRVALARCLANDPRLILMDEPLGALDALTREKMQSLILRLWRETGKTIVLITHSVEEALLLGERVIVMAPRPGRVARDLAMPFAARGVGADLRLIKRSRDFGAARDALLAEIWDMEEEIMAGADARAVARAAE